MIGNLRRGSLQLLSLLCAACSRGPLPNVVLVTFDTTRYDRFGCTGDPEARTPGVDALAEGGLIFERAYASVPLTLPSHTTMMTGLEPPAHGVHNNGKFRVPEELDTLAEILKRSGYATAAFVSAFVLDPRFRLDQGFDVYSGEVERNRDPLSMMVAQRPGADVTDEALDWLDEQTGDAPYFLWAHYYDPHLPRRPQRGHSRPRRLRLHPSCAVDPVGTGSAHGRAIRSPGAARGPGADDSPPFLFIGRTPTARVR